MTRQPKKYEEYRYFTSSVKRLPKSFGKQAALMRLSREQNPYEILQHREAWFEGYDEVSPTNSEST